MQTAGALIRVSTVRQLEGTSPEKQLEGILALAADQGFNVPEAHRWQLAESGARRDREGFRSALDAAEAGRVQRIYVFSVDRLGRSLLEMLLFLRDLEDRRIECWAADTRRRLASDDFLLQIEGAVAGRERQEIIRRTQDGLRRAIQMGKYSGGIVAFGYRLNRETKELEVDDEEAAVVRLVFAWCTDERLSCQQIADRLNAMGVAPKYVREGRAIRRPGKRSELTSGIWRAGRVRQILTNPAYAGRWEWGKRSTRLGQQRIQGKCPPIVSTETAARAGEVLHANTWARPAQERRRYLLRGLIICAHCGTRYVGTASHVKGGIRSYYKCTVAFNPRRFRKPPCPSKHIRADLLEAVVWDDIKAFVQRPEVVLDQLRKVRAPIDAALPDRLREVEGQLVELERRERNLLRLAAESQEASPQALDDVLSELRGSRRSLLAYRADLQSRRERGEGLDRELFGVADRLRKLQARIDETSWEERRRAVEHLVRSIEVTPTVQDGRKVSVATITYRFAAPEDLPPTPAPPMQKTARVGVQASSTEAWSSTGDGARGCQNSDSDEGRNDRGSNRSPPLGYVWNLG